jgi:hypothetical protein
MCRFLRFRRFDGAIRLRAKGRWVTIQSPHRSDIDIDIVSQMVAPFKLAHTPIFPALRDGKFAIAIFDARPILIRRVD